MVKYKDVNIGDRVKVSVIGSIREGVVEYKSRDIKNGIAGIDYTGDDGNSYWSYLDQIISVTKG